MIQHRHAMHAAQATKPLRPPAPLAAASQPAFTLIELVVVLTIVSILASLTLAGLAVTRQRAKIDKTKSTIRKLSEIVIPRYQHYTKRRIRLADVPEPNPATCPSCYDGGATVQRRINAWKMMVSRRYWAMAEMPDTWEDVGLSKILPAWHSSAVRAYDIAKTTASPKTNSNEECLYLIIARGGFETDLLETFRNDEIADTDNDGAPEFIDGWGTPIKFLRWAPGHSDMPLSFVQYSSASESHDPFDPLRVDAVNANAYSLVPLIVSAGPDLALGLDIANRQAVGWHGVLLGGSVVGADSITGRPDSSGAAMDNISNHNFAAR